MKKPLLPQIPPKQKQVVLYLASLFKINGKQGNDVVTEGQLAILWTLIFRPNKRVIIICSTQYGKSLWVALACIVIACIQGIRVCIVAPSDEKAKIIMRYFIEHLGDHPLFYSKLNKNSKLERLRQEESKERIILNNGGGIFVVSAQQRNATKSIEAAMGQGAEIVIGDEYNLIQDTTEATIFRMIAGKTEIVMENGEKKAISNAFYCKIGNPFYSNVPYTHFKKSWEDPRYLKIFIDYLQGLREGRYTQEFIDEAMEKPLFDVLFECKFPPEDVQDIKGYRPLVLSDDIKFGITPDELKEKIIKHKEENGGVLKIRPKLGADISGGGDKNPLIVRWGKYACVARVYQSKDTMVNITEIEDVAKDFCIEWEDVNIDDIGIGRGVTDRLKEKGYEVNGVSVGETARDKETYFNLKAELYWATRLWIKDPESTLDERPEWSQLTWIKYKTNSERRVQIQPKPELKKGNGNKSPDFAEGLMLTFYERPFIGFA